MKRRSRLRSKIRQLFFGYDEDFRDAQPLSTLPARTWAFITGSRWQTVVTKPEPKALPQLAGESAGEPTTTAILSKMDMDGSVAYRLEPRESWIQSVFAAWLKSRGKKSLPYPLYAIARFGFWDAMFRTWVYHVHPKNALDWLQTQIRRYHLKDRRPKKGYSKTVYAVDRDGDLYLVECPQCHDTQSILFNWRYSEERDEEGYRKGRAITEVVPPKTFQCYSCDIGFHVYLEDGLRFISDHRDGVPPLPSKVVWDDRGKIHLGISKDAPWWWNRREICRDLRDGKDAHGHHKYEIFPTTPGSAMCEAGQANTQGPPEVEQPK